MIIERHNDDSKKRKVENLQCGECFMFDDADTVYIKTEEIDDHSCETLCVGIEEGTTIMAANNSLVIPIKAKVVIET